MTTYTLEVYKRDRRLKAGERLVHTKDYENMSGNAMMDLIYMLKQDTYPLEKGYRMDFEETYVTRKNLLTGEEYQERYDTPYSCSPSSETYWSM